MVIKVLDAPWGERIKIRLNVDGAMMELVEHHRLNIVDPGWVSRRRRCLCSSLYVSPLLEAYHLHIIKCDDNETEILSELDNERRSMKNCLVRESKTKNISADQIHNNDPSNISDWSERQHNDVITEIFGEEDDDSGHLYEKPRYATLASIRHGDSFSGATNFTHRCTGVLVTPSIIATVAHCLHDQYGNYFFEPATYRVVIGASLNAEDSKFLLVAAVRVHRRYLIENKVNDFAMMKLKEAQSLVVPDLSSLRFENLPNFTDCVFYGWVFMDSKNEVADELVFTHFRTIYKNRQDCYLEMATSQNYMTPKTLCFVVPHFVKGACLYNAGTPIFCVDTVVGLLSYLPASFQFETAGNLALFTLVSNYVNLIEDFAKESGSSRFTGIMESIILLLANVYFVKIILLYE